MSATIKWPTITRNRLWLLLGGSILCAATVLVTMYMRFPGKAEVSVGWNFFVAKSEMTPGAVLAQAQAEASPQSPVAPNANGCPSGTMFCLKANGGTIRDIHVIDARLCTDRVMHGESTGGGEITGFHAEGVTRNCPTEAPQPPK
jgi:hypothetical protein